VAAGSEGCIWFWDAQTYQLLLTRYVFSVEAYLDIILPDGCFDANEAGMKYLCYTETDSLTSCRASVSERTILSTLGFFLILLPACPPKISTSIGL
jgi:hypothetical protein